MPVPVARVALTAALLAAPLASIAEAVVVPRRWQGTALLVTPQQLARELRDPSLVLLHVGPREDYDAGHIAGARFIELQQLAAPRQEGALALELPNDAALRTALEGLGIGDRSRVVVVPGVDWGSPATRVLFTLQAAGLGDRTRLLDGGSEAWKRAGLPVTKEVPPPAARGRLTLPADRSVVVDHAWIQRRIGAPGVRVIDARTPVFFEGPGMRDRSGMNHAAGHVPGARNLPFNSLMDDSLKVLPVAELRRLFANAGVQPGDTVAAYCHIGQQATVVVFAARLLGIPARLYDGSWDDWERRGLPVENAAAPRRPGEGRR